MRLIRRFRLFLIHSFSIFAGKIHDGPSLKHPSPTPPVIKNPPLSQKNRPCHKKTRCAGGRGGGKLPFLVALEKFTIVSHRADGVL